MATSLEEISLMGGKKGELLDAKVLFSSETQSGKGLFFSNVFSQKLLPHNKTFEGGRGSPGYITHEKTVQSKGTT